MHAACMRPVQIFIGTLRVRGALSMKLSSLAIPTLLVTSLVGCATAADGDDGSAQSNDELQLAQLNWRDAIATTPTGDGCFQATFPSMAWESVACTTAPNRPVGSPVARSAGHTRAAAGPFVVGDGADFALHVPGLISSSTGSFP